jgi:hypothetical protein
MPTNRVPIERPRRLSIAPEAVELFRALEATPQSMRTSDEFRAGDRELHRLLDLETEWWQSGNVLSRAEESCYPPTMLAYDAFHRCSALREALLEAAAIRDRSVFDASNTNEKTAPDVGTGAA